MSFERGVCGESGWVTEVGWRGRGEAGAGHSDSAETVIVCLRDTRGRRKEARKIVSFEGRLRGARRVAGFDSYVINGIVTFWKKEKRGGEGRRRTIW